MNPVVRGIPKGRDLYAFLAPLVRADDSQQFAQGRSEEHTSELQSHSDLVCRLLLEKKKKCRGSLRQRNWHFLRLNSSLRNNCLVRRANCTSHPLGRMSADRCESFGVLLVYSDHSAV